MNHSINTENENDSIDLDDILASGASEEMTQVIGASEDISAALEVDSVKDSTEFIKGNEILSQFNEINKDIATSLSNRAEGALLRKLESNEEYIKAIAGRLYLDIFKAAQKYIRVYCALNKKTQKWSNPFMSEFKAKYLKANSAFIPQIYSVSLVDNETREIQNLVYFAKTSKQAAISAAKAIGFDNSAERKLVFQKYSESTVRIILEDPKYLKEQEILDEFEELRRQIDSRRYAPSYLRERWRKELEDKYNQRNGLI